MKIVAVVGARPNFIKIAPLIEQAQKYRQIKIILVHTGQHYDYEMSQIFFQELKIPRPTYNLDIGSASHAQQTAKIMLKLEPILLKEKPNLVLVIGDVNSTLAAALVAAKLHLSIAHLEAGPREFDKQTPEEINRILVDHLSDYLFCPTKASLANLKQEGIKKGIYKTGDIMYQICQRALRLAQKKSSILTSLDLKPKNYYLATVHRPQNTDCQERLKNIIDVFCKIKNLVFPCHPRTEKYLKQYQLWEKLNQKVKVIKPLGYIDMVWLEKNAKKIITDSGGIQKEAYWLKVPCLTLKDKTAWLMTLNNQANVLVDADKKKIQKALIRSIKKQRCQIPKTHNQDYFYNKGNTAKKILDVLIKNFP